MERAKKLLAFLLSLAMTLSIVPVTVFAADAPNQIDTVGDVAYFDAAGAAANANNFVVSTSKTIAPAAEENNFEVTLEVQTTVDIEKISADPHAAVVLVMDVSDSMEGSRLTAAKKAAIEFIQSYVKDAEGAARQLSIVTFYGIGNGKKNNPYKGFSEVVLDWTDLTTAGTADAESVINGLDASLGTFTQGGLMLARNLYLPANVPEVMVDNETKVIDNRFVILLTDGNPTHMLGTANTRLGRITGYTNNLASTSVDSLTGNLLTGVENSTNVPPARDASAAAALQIKNGGFNGGYSAQLFTIGFGISGTKYANTFGGSSKYSGDEWLQKVIASDQMHYNVNDANKLNLAFESISETITRIANAWKVTDPMANYIDYGSDAVINDAYNKASFNAEDGTLSWSIKASSPVATDSVKRGNKDTTIYTYKLAYNITLDNLSGYKAEDVINTNERTFLEYIVSAKAIDLTDEDNYVEADFTIPQIHGFEGELSFAKTDAEGAPLAGAEFTLFLGEDAFATAVSDTEGNVAFAGIPSGHSYTLKETVTPEDYDGDDAEYAVDVSYGDVTVNGDSPNGFTVVNTKLAGQLVIEKLWVDENGDEAVYPNAVAAFTVMDENQNVLDAITAPGEYDVEPGVYTVVENAIENFNLIDISGDDSAIIDLADRIATVTVRPNGVATVVFTNQYVPPVVPKTQLIIEKRWVDENGVEAVYPEAVATFVLQDVRVGDLIDPMALPGTYELKPSIYKITENAIDNFELIDISGNSNDVDVGDGYIHVFVNPNETETVVFTNQYVPTEFVGTISLDKVVLDDNEQVMIAQWLIENVTDYDVDTILEDITFEIYNATSDGRALDQIAGVVGTIDPFTSQITFADSQGTRAFTEGWYLVREVLGSVASQVFQDPIADLLIYFNGSSASAKTGQGGTTVDRDASFTITQYKDQSRPVQAIYRNEAGKLNYLRNAPALNSPDRPNNGGGALGTSRFTATADNGTTYMSFCADIGAIGVKGTYYVDENQHGLSDDEVLKLIAALDYVYNRYGFEDYEGVALAQLVVWNLVLEYSDDPMVADMWLRDLASGLLYSDAWGELIKIEGYNNTNGKNYWYTPGYKAVIDDIIDSAYSNKYVDIYQARVLEANKTYISDAVFLKGDNSFADFYQQRQLLILFDDPAVVENIPKVPEEFIGVITLNKTVKDGIQNILISSWMSENVPAEDIPAIQDDISFEIYTSDADGIEGTKLGAIGIIDWGNGAVNFYKADTYETNPELYDFGSGWYLIKEVMGPVASKIFQGNAQLVVYFNAEIGTIVGNTVEITAIPVDTTFTITQYKNESRPVQAIYRDETGKLRYLRNAPALDSPARPNNGGGALSTTRFQAVADNGATYMSYCADNGAIGVKGTYVIDPNNFGFTDAQVEMLVAAIDHIYTRSEFSDYEDIALAQIVVWNMVLEFSDNPRVSDLWLRDITAGLLYTEAWGELIKIEGYNNTNGKNYWYTPEYKALVDDILANPGKYVAEYKAAIRSGTRASFVGGAVFLKGDGSFESFYQQNQILIQFGDPPAIENLPADEEVTYTVTFVDWDDTELDVQTIVEGEDAVAPGDPVRAGYTFTGWEGDYTNVTESLTIKALYEEEAKTYTITFMSWDGEDVLGTQELTEGDEVNAPEAPERDGYVFTEWHIDGPDEDGNYIYTAVYEETTYRPYIAFFRDKDGNLLEAQRVPVGKDVVPPPYPAYEGHTFRAWHITGPDEDGNYTFTATYDPAEYTITFMSWDSEDVLGTQTLMGGDTVNAPEAPEREGYVFAEWDITGPDEDGNYVYTATYTEEGATTYTVTFIGWDGETLDIQTVAEGEDAVPPEAPEIEGLTFIGWGEDYTNVTKDIEIPAIYIDPEAEKEYVVAILDYATEEFIYEGTLESGDSFTITIGEESFCELWVDGEMTNTSFSFETSIIEASDENYQLDLVWGEEGNVTVTFTAL